MPTFDTDPVQLALSAEGVETRQRACQPSSPVRVGLLMNPKARRLRRSGERAALADLLGERDAWMETHDLASLRRALAFLLCVRAANVLAVAGGDGTVHHVVNALLALGREAEAATGVRPPLPRLLILNGGTLNIVGRTVAIHGAPRDTLRNFLRYFQGAPLSRVPARRLPLLEVRCGVAPESQSDSSAAPRTPSWTDLPPRWGFVFGSEAAFHALELYGRFGAGYLGLSRFLLEFFRGALVGGELWDTEGWKLGPYADLRVDDQTFGRYSGVVASTVDLTLAIGSVRTIRRSLHRPGFAARVVEETDLSRLMRVVPGLMSERSVAGVRDFPEATRMDLSGPYTLDGECFSEPAVSSARQPLVVTASTERLHAVPGDFTADEW